VSDEVILKAHTLLIERPTGETTQPAEDVAWLGTPEGMLEPPIQLEVLRDLSRIHDVRSSCIDAIATNTVGLGYSLTVVEGREQDIPDPTADAHAAVAELEALASRDERLDRPSLTTLLRAVKWDEEEVGQGYLEVARDKRTGRPNGLFHLPAVRMRRLGDRSGWVLLAADGNLDAAVKFYNWGEKVRYDRKGQPQSTLVPGRRWARNEVLRFKLYSSEDRDYGMPRDVAMALEYAGDKLAKESNVSFFDSSGTPPTVIFVQGEENRDGTGKVTFKVPRETADRIADTLKSDSGHRHRVAIIPVPPGTATKEVKLGEFSDRDVGFVSFRQDNARRTLSSFRLQPIFVPAVSEDGRYTAEVQRAITLEQLFDPEQRRYEGSLSEGLLRELGYDHLRIKFRRLAVEDDKSRRDSADKMAETGTTTHREYRAAHGYGPLPEAAKGATPEPGQVEFGWNDQLIEAKGPPAGAENRNSTDDTRGLRPGIAGREASERHEKNGAGDPTSVPAP